MEPAGTNGPHRRPLSDPWNECRSCGLSFFWLRQPDLEVPLAEVMLSVQTMDNAVALVQAYLRVNGYFTVAEYPASLKQSGMASTGPSPIWTFWLFDSRIPVG